MAGRENENWISKNLKEGIRKSGKFLPYEWAGVVVTAFVLPARLVLAGVLTAAHTALYLKFKDSQPIRHPSLV